MGRSEKRVTNALWFESSDDKFSKISFDIYFLLASCALKITRGSQLVLIDPFG